LLDWTDFLLKGAGMIQDLLSNDRPDGHRCKLKFFGIILLIVTQVIAGILIYAT
jgi:hypothetical protein